MVSQLTAVITFHRLLLLVLQRKQILDKECVLFFPVPPHQIISTRAPHNVNCSPCFYIHGSGWIIVKPNRNLPLKNSDSDLSSAFLHAQVRESCSRLCFFVILIHVVVARWYAGEQQCGSRPQILAPQRRGKGASIVAWASPLCCGLPSIPINPW